MGRDCYGIANGIGWGVRVYKRWADIISGFIDDDGNGVKIILI